MCEREKTKNEQEGWKEIEKKREGKKEKKTEGKRQRESGKEREKQR